MPATQSHFLANKLPCWVALLPIPYTVMQRLLRGQKIKALVNRRKRALLTPMLNVKLQCIVGNM